MRTPGPWTISEGARIHQWIVERIGSCAEDSAQVADVYTGENDARLIAAAPALLEALEAVLANHCESWEVIDKLNQRTGDCMCSVCQKARAAIALVKGETV